MDGEKNRSRFEPTLDDAVGGYEDLDTAHGKDLDEDVKKILDFYNNPPAETNPLFRLWKLLTSHSRAPMTPERARKLLQDRSSREKLRDKGVAIGQSSNLEKIYPSDVARRDNARVYTSEISSATTRRELEMLRARLDADKQGRGESEFDRYVGDPAEKRSLRQQKINKEVEVAEQERDANTLKKARFAEQSKNADAYLYTLIPSLGSLSALQELRELAQVALNAELLREEQFVQIQKAFDKKEQELQKKKRREQDVLADDYLDQLIPSTNSISGLSVLLKSAEVSLSGGLIRSEHYMKIITEIERKIAILNRN